VAVEVVVHTFNVYVRAVFLDVFCVTVILPSVKCNVTSRISAELGEHIDSGCISHERSLCRDLLSVSDYFMFMVPCIIIYSVKYPTDAAMCNQFYSTAVFTIHVSGVLHTHHQEYNF